jgi:ubiquinone/menaquinone biosynthesis C-methylase UbiE
MFSGFSSPDLNLAPLNVLPGMIVADLGAGTGAYARAAAKMVGTHGKVYAIDVQKELLGRLKAEADHEGLANIEYVWGDVEVPAGTHLKEASVDRVIIANLLFQVEDKAAVMKEAARILKPGGFVLVVDWTDSHGGLGPVQDMVVTADMARALGEAAGLEHSRGSAAGDHHYGLLFKKA